jgi:predicted metalloprotease
MRWDDFRRSDDIEDRRGDGEGGGGGFGLPIGGGGLGIGALVVIGLIGWATGIDPSYLIEMVSGGGGGGFETSDRPSPGRVGAPSDAEGSFVAAVKGEIDDRWKEIFAADKLPYRDARLVLFQGGTRAGQCGFAQSAMGPFYCPPEREIFLDTGFFDEIERRFHGCSGPACKFTQAYVIAHEAGHHIQNLLGILPKAQQEQEAQRAAGKSADANRMQVRVELQADCFAGVWTNQENKKRNFLDPGDIDAALQTAAAIGDDTLQRKAQGRVVPETFTHGSAEQRKRWFLNGFNSGKVSACNTFTTTQL